MENESSNPKELTVNIDEVIPPRQKSLRDLINEVCGFLDEEDKDKQYSLTTLLKRHNRSGMHSTIIGYLQWYFPDKTLQEKWKLFFDYFPEKYKSRID